LPEKEKIRKKERRVGENGVAHVAHVAQELAELSRRRRRPKMNINNGSVQ
jgi:hypothetical protein